MRNYSAECLIGNDEMYRMILCTRQEQPYLSPMRMRPERRISSWHIIICTPPPPFANAYLLSRIYPQISLVNIFFGKMTQV
jgi:hypothetical protein